MSDMEAPRIRVLPDAGAVATAAAECIVDAARTAIELNDEFSLALCGGNTPQALYRLLAEEPFASRIDWPRVQVLFTDERCVPPDSAESNFRLACELLLDRVEVPYDNIHRMRGEVEPQAAAEEYDRLLREHFGEAGLDLALLGMGVDGHTTSLFPGTAALSEQERLCVANWVPNLKAWRLTLTAPFLNRSRAGLVLVTGKEKAATLARVLEEEPDPQEAPIRLIDPVEGELLWLVDASAAGMEGE